MHHERDVDVHWQTQALSSARQERWGARLQRVAGHMRPPASPGGAMRSSLCGILLIVASAVCFGSMAVLGHVAYRDGVDTHTLLLLRFSIAAAVMALLTCIVRARFPRGRALGRHVLLGALYAGVSWAYFSALHHAASSTVAMLLYTYPILVALAAAGLGLDRLGTSEAVGLVIASTGVVLILGAAAPGAPAGWGLAVVAAVLYTAYVLVGTSSSHDVHPLASSTVVLASAALILLPMTLGTTPHWPGSGAAWAAVAALALLATAVAIVAFLEGLRRLGPTLSAVLSMLEPLVTVLLGALVLDEHPSRTALIGGGLILLTSIYLSIRRARRVSLRSMQTVRSGHAQ